MVGSPKAKKAIKETLNQAEELKPSFEGADVKLEVEPAPKAPPKPDPKIDPKVKTYICKVKCWIPKRGIFERGDYAEFIEGEFVPSQFELVK